MQEILFILFIHMAWINSCPDKDIYRANKKEAIHPVLQIQIEKKEENVKSA